MKFSEFFLIAAALMITACSPLQAQKLEAKEQTAIIGGTLVKKDSLIGKSTVGIYNANTTSVCTGVLLENNIILTAGHCVDDDISRTFVVFNRDMESLLDDYHALKSSPITRRVTGAVVHDRYKTAVDVQEAGTEFNDIALLKFNGTIPKGYKPAKVLKDMGKLQEGVKTVVAGYGVQTANLVEIDLKQTPDLQELINEGAISCDDDDATKATSCVAEDLDGPAILKSTTVKIKDFPNAFEARVEHIDGHGPCSGDSGGPAFLKLGDDYFVWGITSRGELGCSTFSTYTNVVSYEVWIKRESANLLKKK